jgi:type VI secretion system protein VasD
MLMSMGYVARIGCALALLAVAACASPPPKPVPAKLAIQAAADINPDSGARASPVVVRFFQLKTDAEFAGAQFFPLYDNEKAVLGAGLISRDEYTLTPGQRQQLEVPVSPDTRFFGVMAAFRDPDAQWRVVVPASAKSIKNGFNGTRLTIQLTKTAVALTVND